MGDSLAGKIQIKIRDTGLTNKEFAKSAGIKKNELDSILKGIAPNQYTLGKICRALDWEWTPEPVKVPAPVRTKIQKHVQADFNKKPKSPLKAKGNHCFRCHFKEGIHVYDTIEMAHYSGDRSAAFGKCRGQKGSDILKCPLCKLCHKRFDEPKVRKSVELSEEFLFYIALFIAQEFEAGNIIIKGPKCLKE
ncbi:helix-turn-helix transcriptional regulator [Candidatus Pacearchaeota archaeon]|nr:helix-turn-helix transcriptional regulator [Candidatus Pacearchaeota archaeon]